ncbi:hypothetical protein ACFVIB_01360 [Streptomyces nigra]
MAAAIVYPPADEGGRRVQVGGKILGRAFRVLDIAASLQKSGL